MKSILQATATVALFFVCLVLWDAHYLLRTATFTLLELQDTLSDASSTLTASRVTIARLDQTVSDSQAFLKAAQPLFRAETQRIQASTLELQKTEASARLLIVRTNESLNGKPGLPGLIPQATSTLADFDATADQFSRDSAATLGQTQNLILQLSQDAADPSIQSSLRNIDRSSAEIAATTADLRQVADKFRSDYLKPQKVAWELLKTLIGMGGSLAQMVR